LASYGTGRVRRHETFGLELNRFCEILSVLKRTVVVGSVSNMWNRYPWDFNRRFSLASPSQRCSASLSLRLQHGDMVPSRTAEVGFRGG
jgi:hypothetical protein